MWLWISRTTQQLKSLGMEKKAMLKDVSERTRKIQIASESGGRGERELLSEQFMSSFKHYFAHLTSRPASISMTDRVAQTTDGGLHGHCGCLACELRNRPVVPRGAGGPIANGSLVSTVSVLLAATTGTPYGGPAGLRYKMHLTSSSRISYRRALPS